MQSVKVSVVPVGKLDAAELAHAAARAAKILHGAVDVRRAVAVPRGAEDVARGQHRAETLLTLLAPTASAAAVEARVVPEGDPPPGPWIPAPGVPVVFVTDVDLFTRDREGVLAHAEPSRHVAVVSVRRLREAFWRRKADPGKQRARLVKELVHAAGTLRGLRDCPDPGCAMSPELGLQDVDRKGERLCGPCAKRI